jgi:hypothetical protein
MSDLSIEEGHAIIEKASKWHPISLKKIVFAASRVGNAHKPNPCGTITSAFLLQII